MRLAKAKKDGQSQPMITPVEEADYIEPEPEATVPDGEPQEKEIVRLLLMYGNRMIDWDGITNTYIGPFIIAELSDVEFEQPVCKQFVAIYKEQTDNGKLPDEQYFINHPDAQIVNLAIDLLSVRYELSANWYEMHKIFVPDEDLKKAVFGGIYHLKKQKVNKILEKLRTDLQTTVSETDQEILLNQYIFMKKVEKKIVDYLGSVILK